MNQSNTAFAIAANRQAAGYFNAKQITMSPQSAVVLKHLLAQGSITAVEAQAVHRVRSVSRRITEIQDAGFWVDKVQSKDVTGQRYVRYVLPL